jgi:hypothetical protein
MCSVEKDIDLLIEGVRIFGLWAKCKFSCTMLLLGSLLLISSPVSSFFHSVRHMSSMIL